VSLFFSITTFLLKFQGSFVKEGRNIIDDLEVGELTLTLSNIFAPNTDDPAFFKNVSEQMLSFKCDEIIIVGDFNLVLDVSKDKTGRKPMTEWNSPKELKYIQESLDFTDIWRDLKPNAKRYTWRRNRSEEHGHHFFLVSLSIAGRISNADILPGYKTDHSLCKIDINYHSNPRGPNFWKFNSALLSEVDYVNAIESIIAKIASEYKSNEEVNEVLLWEMIKLKIRDASMKYSKVKVKKMTNEEASIESALATLEGHLEQGENNKYVLEE